MSDYFKRVSAQTATRFWINNVTRNEADMALDAGAVGCTQNPSYVWKMFSHAEEGEYAKSVAREFIKTESDDTEVLIKTQRELVAGVAKRFMPLFEATKGKWGYVSIQGSPIDESAENIIRCARYNHAAGPNIMAKIPVTEDGLKAIEVLVKEGVPINATECMAIRQVLDVCEVYERATEGMDNPAPIYFSLITGIYDEYCQKYVKENGIEISPDALWQAGMAIAKKTHALVKEKRYPVGFIGGGARGLHHFTEMVGADASITINWQGTADKLLELDKPVTQNFYMPTPYSVEDELLEKLDVFRKAYMINGIKPEEYEDFGPVVLFRESFVSAWNDALNEIASMRKNG